jgi:hypothetical protein
LDAHHATVSDLVERLRERRTDNDALSASDELEMLRSWCLALGAVNGHLGTVVRVTREWAHKDDQGGGYRAAREEVRAMLRRPGV